MSRLIRILATLALVAYASPAALADALSAVARIDPGRSSVTDDGTGLAVALALSQPVPWRAFTLADPPRLVLDFREVDWRGRDAPALLGTTRATGIRTGGFRTGWSRLVVDLAGPFAIASAGMETGDASGGAMLRLRLDRASEAVFRSRAGAPVDADWGTADTADAHTGRGGGAITVVLDPGHGGIDPGAEADGISEADLMLAFALDLQEALIRSGDFRVVLTRTDDVFLPLDGRITRARAAGADIFISLHADAVTEGRASGATVYTLSETTSDEASAALAERHDRSELLAGVDLTDQDDVVAELLMDIARLDTGPRGEALADAVVAGLESSVGGLHKRLRRAAGFSVLRAADIPSILIELGFVSSASDLSQLRSAEWRAKAAAGIAGGLIAWTAEDSARAALLRR